MSGIAGVEIGVERVRVVVRLRGGTLHTYEMPCATERVNDMVSQLSAAAGDVRAIGLAIGLAHLYVKQVTLPPVSHAERRQMLSVEPERWFAVAQGAPTAVSLTPAGDIALGADGAFVDACVRAFAKWAPVMRVEAAPLALARALTAAGHRSATAAIDAGVAEVGLIETHDGALRTVRRARAVDLSSPPASPPAAAGLDPAFSVALGAALGFDGSIDAMLLTPALERSFVKAQRRRLVTWAAAATLAVATALWSAGVARTPALCARK